jgi:hypothetical protein
MPAQPRAVYFADENALVLYRATWVTNWVTTAPDLPGLRRTANLI